MLKFPNKVEMKIVDSNTRQAIKISNIIMSIHLFAIQKNDYYLGPFFTNENGEVRVNGHILDISVEAELQTGLMDYRPANECSSRVEISILSIEQIATLIKGRSLWGVIGRENELYGTKEELLSRIRKSNNHLVQPNCLQVTWDKDVDEGVYEILTRRRTEG